MFVICVEAIRYFLLYNLHNCSVTSNINTISNIIKTIEIGVSADLLLYIYSLVSTRDSNHRATVNCFVFVIFSQKVLKKPTLCLEFSLFQIWLKNSRLVFSWESGHCTKTVWEIIFESNKINRN